MVTVSAILNFPIFRMHYRQVIYGCICFNISIFLWSTVHFALASLLSYPYFSLFFLCVLFELSLRMRVLTSSRTGYSKANAAYIRTLASCWAFWSSLPRSARASVSSSSCSRRWSTSVCRVLSLNRKGKNYYDGNSQKFPADCGIFLAKFLILISIHFKSKMAWYVG